MAIKEIFNNSGKREYTGLSSDVKPTTNMGPGSKFFETDTGDWYRKGASGWVKDNKIGCPAFEISCAIARSATVNAYAAGQIINGTGATTLPALDFSAVAAASQKIQVTGVILLSSNGAAALKLSPIIVLFNANALTDQTLTDYTAFAPSYAQYVAKHGMRIDSSEWGPAKAFGAGVYDIPLTDVARIVTLDAEAKIYPALIANNAYVPASAEILTLVVKGFLL